MPRPRVGRRVRRLAVALALLPLLLSAAAASCEPPDVLLPQGPRVLAPGSREILDVFVQNRNVVGVTITLNVSAPSGWTARLDDERVALGPRTPDRANATVLKLSIVAPERGAGLAGGEMQLVARAECPPPVGATSPQSAAVVGVRLAETPGPGLALGVGVLVLGIVVVGVWRARRTRPFVRMTCAKPEMTVAAGKGGSFPLHLENVRSRPETVQLRLEGIPLGWSAFVPLAEVRLEPGEAKELWLLVRPPPYAHPGVEARILVRAIPRAAAAVPPIALHVRVGNP